jgi:glutaredoxin-like protein NrdH
MTTVTLFTAPSCVQCTATKRALDQRGITYDVVDISQDLEARDRFVAMGHRSAPVVVVGDDNWSGFRPDKIAALAA